MRKKDFGESAFNEVYGAYVYVAKKKEIVFNLSKEEFKELTQKNCFYCGCKPSNNKRRSGERAKANTGNFIYNGLDKVNPSLGYVLNNVVSCCLRCNRAKRDVAQEKFLLWIERVYNHSNLGDSVDATHRS